MSATPNPPPPEWPPPPEFSPESPQALPAGPDHRDLYLLVIGIVLGIVLGPSVLGRLTPATYDKWFVGSAELRAEYDRALGRVEDKLESFGARAKERQAQLRESKASPEAGEELARTLRAELKAILREDITTKAVYMGGPAPRDGDEDPLQTQPASADRLLVDGKIPAAERARLEWLTGRLMALVVGVAVMMVLETLIDPRAAGFWPRLRNGLTTARYALVALWVALLLARPALLVRIPGAFVLLLIFMALIVAAVPLRRAAAKNRSQDVR